MSRARRVNGSRYESFIAKVAIDHETGCWNWTAATTKGYASLKHIRAHRFSYEHHIGPVPEGHELHHVCGNTLCVNPIHVVPVTRLEHARLGARAQSSLCRRGHELTPDNLVAGRKWRTCKRCHRERMYAVRHGIARESEPLVLVPR